MTFVPSHPIFHSFLSLLLERSITWGELGVNVWWLVFMMRFPLKFATCTFSEFVNKNGFNFFSWFLLISKYSSEVNPERGRRSVMIFPARFKRFKLFNTDGVVKLEIKFCSKSKVCNRRQFSTFTTELRSLLKLNLRTSSLVRYLSNDEWISDISLWDRSSTLKLAISAIDSVTLVSWFLSQWSISKLRR